MRSKVLIAIIINEGEDLNSAMVPLVSLQEASKHQNWTLVKKLENFVAWKDELHKNQFIFHLIAKHA
jgi:hypothetical protein